MWTDGGQDFLKMGLLGRSDTFLWLNLWKSGMHLSFFCKTFVLLVEQSLFTVTLQIRNLTVIHTMPVSAHPIFDKRAEKTISRGIRIYLDCFVFLSVLCIWDDANLGLLFLLEEKSIFSWWYRSEKDKRVPGRGGNWAWHFRQVFSTSNSDSELDWHGEVHKQDRIHNQLWSSCHGHGLWQWLQSVIRKAIKTVGLDHPFWKRKDPVLFTVSSTLQMIILLWFLEKTTLGERHVNLISLLVKQISESCRGKPCASEALQ